MKNRLNRGFTLIELLVVIAIIGILSSVVLGFINDARNKGADASIKNSLASMRSEAENYFDVSAVGYRVICAEGKIPNLLLAAKNASGGIVGECTATVSGSAWAAWVPLKSSVGGAQVWCVDSLGTSKQIAKPAGAGKITVCP